MKLCRVCLKGFYLALNKYSLFFLFSTIVVFALGISSSFTINPLYFIFGIGLGVFAYFKPNYSIYFLLFLLPLFGDRPSKPQVHYLVMYSSFIIFGIYLKLFLHKMWLKRFLARIRIHNICIFFVYLFMVVSFLSLVGLPLLGMVKKTFEEDKLYIITQLLSVGETTLYSSVQSVVLLFQSFLIGLYMYGSLRKSERLKVFKNILTFIVLGFLFSVIIGHLDFFGVYDISWYRAVDSANPNRFHSFFVNSSWYSQYIAVILPMLPIVLLHVKHKKLAIALLVLLIILGEVTLILSMQRGAWITYPPTLLLIWVSIYYVIAKMKDTSISLRSFLKKNWLKVVVTIPITVTLSVYIVYGIKDYRKIHGIQSATDTFLDVTNRAERVAKTNDRLKHWPPAIKFWQLNPIFGAGGDSFGWQYKIYCYEKGAKYKGTSIDTLKLNQFGTAHNLYLQTLTGKGIFGLVFLLGFIFSLLYMLIKKEFLSIKSRSIDESIISLVLLGSLLATIIYANVQEIFYIQSVSIIFWMVYFMGVSLVFDSSKKSTRKTLEKMFRYTIYLMLLLLPFHVFNISYVKEFVAKKIPFFSGSILDMIVWIALAVVIYSIYMQKKVIKHSSVSDFFIDDDKSDKPQMFHKAPTPRAGGIGIFFANLFLIFNPLGWQFLVAALPAFGAGLMDDFKSLTPKTRLFLQTISGILCVWVFNSYIVSFGFDVGINFYLGAFIAIVAVVGAINAINIIDGFNGLASGFAMMVFISFGYVAWMNQDITMFEIAVINIAAVGGFMLFNYPKGKIFLGDGGAYFLGFALASLSMVLVIRDDISQLYPLAILIYPAFEVAFSMYRRKIVKKTKMTKNDKYHLHQMIYYRVTKNNPATSKYIWIRVLPFMIVSTIFYKNDLVQLGVIVFFCIFYVNLYNKLVKFKRHKTKF